MPLFEVRGPFGARIIAFCSWGSSSSNPFDGRDVGLWDNRAGQFVGVGVVGDTGYDAVWSCLEWAVIMILDWSLARWKCANPYCTFLSFGCQPAQYVSYPSISAEKECIYYFYSVVFLFSIIYMVAIFKFLQVIITALCPLSQWFGIISQVNKDNGDACGQKSETKCIVVSCEYLFLSTAVMPLPSPTTLGSTQIHWLK